MSPILSIVLATSNSGKIAELRALLDGLPIQLLGVAEVLGYAPSIVEDGATFEANAALKARAVMRLTQLASLADDSGLEVDALGGRPGVRSARFAHAGASDAENNAALLRELEAVSDPARTARFRCVLALADPWSEGVRVAEGYCDGQIARAPRGSAGFGYDPLFVPSEYDGRSMAELSQQEKNAVSHRAKAAVLLRANLTTLVNECLTDAERIVGP